MALATVRGLFPDDAYFLRGMSGLLHAGDVRLIEGLGMEPPQWRWHEVLANPAEWPTVHVSPTPTGIQRIK